MSHRFLKIGNIVLNTKYIRHIEINEKEYIFHLAKTHIHGGLFLGSGAITTDHGTLVVHEHNVPEDYKKISEWIDVIRKQPYM